MPSSRNAYNDELVEAQRTAVAILHKRMKACEDPVEQCKLAVALLRARPAKDETLPPAPKAPRQPKAHAAGVPDNDKADTPAAAPPPPPYTDEEYGALVLRYGEDKAAQMNALREALIDQFNRARPAANSS